MVLRHDVLERGAVERSPVCAKRKLLPAVDALSLEDGCAVELLLLERPVSGGDLQESFLLSPRGHRRFHSPEHSARHEKPLPGFEDERIIFTELGN